ncbi:MAG: hypothetical protein OXI80_12190 [Caldilineaceae bacterium]|nr:hypothetical protein [Caldilineaceae bacterium]
MTALDELLTLRLAMAAGTATGPLDASTIAAAEIAAGLWERALSAGRSDVLSAAELAIVGRHLVTRGESVWLVPVGGRPVVCADWDVRSAGARPADWWYRVSIAGPSGQVERTADAASVLHFRIRVSDKAPWRGRSPWAVATTTAALASHLEASLTAEESGPIGHVLPVPDLGNAGGVADALPTLRGRTVLGETMGAGWEAGGARAPATREWQPVRIGPEPPENQRALRSDVQDALLAAAGVPVELVRGSGDAREAWRRFLFATIEPVGRLVAAEARRVLGGSGRLDWADLAASDLQGRARAFRQLTDAGMDAEEARRICGFA